MDRMNSMGSIIEAVKKYRYVILVLLAGIFLMLLPTTNDSETVASEPSHSETQPQNLQDSLEEILCQIDGAGKVKVLLTQSAGEQILYQTDENSSAQSGSSNIRVETVIITNSEREETGLVRQTLPPTYLGAIVLCQGAQSASVRFSIVEAVSRVTGLSSNQISVLKMK